MELADLTLSQSLGFCWVWKMTNSESCSSHPGEATEPQKVLAFLGGSSASVGAFIFQRLWWCACWRHFLKESSDSAVSLWVNFILCIETSSTQNLQSSCEDKKGCARVQGRCMSVYVLSHGAYFVLLKLVPPVYLWICWAKRAWGSWWRPANVI